MDTRERLEVIAAYGGVLAGRRHSVAPESSLPYPAAIIHRALAAEIGNPTHPDYMQALTVGYVQLASFLPEAEAALVQHSEDLLGQARDLIGTGAPADRERAMALAAEIPPEVPAIQRRVQARMEARIREVEALQAGTPPPAP